MANSSSSRAFFDWYAATVLVSALVLEETLAARLGAVARPAKGLHGYPRGTDLVRDGDVVAKMIHGGEQDPHVWASGRDARDLAEILRDVWPLEHYLTRVDVAYDFVEGEPWAWLYEACTITADYLDNGEARQRPIKLATVGDWVRAAEGFPGGRTLYVGSFKAPVMARLYEKGKQMRIAFPDQAEKYPAGWVRLELQIRPAKKARYDLARLEPAAMWGASKWARSLHGRVFGGSLEAHAVAEQRPADDERAWRFLLRQYGPLLRKRAGQLGGLHDAEVWRQLGAMLGRAAGAIE